jgi:dienelactone hydrolase
MTQPNTLMDADVAPLTGAYDPFVRGPFPVGVRTIRALDTERDRRFPCEIWYPAATQHAGQDTAPETRDSIPVDSQAASQSQMAVRDAAPRSGTWPLIIYSHPSASHRRAATFLCTHLSGHGYIVAALDHSELVAPELRRREGETAEQRETRIAAVIANRVPDVRFLLDHLQGRAVSHADASLDATRIGIVGHSFGGWTALAAADTDPRIGATVALAPGGGSRPRPGILPLKLAFGGQRDVPTLYLVAENDVSLPLAGMVELFDRGPATKRMVILRRADHCHFMDNVEDAHEALRTRPWGGELAWLNEMRPIAELCTGDSAHSFVRGLTLCHLDAALRQREEARRMFRGDLASELAARGVEAIVHRAQ